MKITGKKGLGDMLKTFLEICFYLGIIILLLLPVGLQAFGLNVVSSIFIIYPNGIILLVIVRKFIELFDSLKNNNPFCEENVKILSKTGIVAFIGACFWMIDLIYETVLAKNFDIVTILILFFLFILYFGVSIALYMLSELFKQATEYKTENDLTI